MSISSHSAKPAAERPASGNSAHESHRAVTGASRIVAEQLPGFSRKLAAMLSAGMPIVASLNALERQARDESFRMVIARVRKSIENGMSLSDAMRQFPTIFDELYANMVRGGESSGQLAETISRLADFLKAAVTLRRKVKSAMTYPVVVLCIAFAITVGLIVFVVPVFADMFAQFSGELPSATRALMSLSEIGRRYGFAVICAGAVLVIAFKKWKATPAGAYAVDSFMLRAPVFGELARSLAAARFSRTLAQLTRSGVPILSALEISAGATGNNVARRLVLDSMKTVERGEPLSEALKDQTVFPGLVAEMLQAGEKTGKVDQMLDCVADFYDEEVSVTLDGLTALLEPILMVILGVIIGGIVICMFLPIFKLPSVIT